MSASRFSRFAGSADDEPSSESKTPSLLERMKNASVDPSMPPKPKPFDMTEPSLQPNGLWCFWLSADERVLRFVAHLHCIIPVSNPPSPFNRATRARMMFGINPRYNQEEAWMWIYRLLEGEAEMIELNDQWLEALGDDEDE